MQPEDFLLAVKNKCAGNVDANVKRVLILFEDKIFYLGDNCTRVDQLRHFGTYFKDAEVHVNFSLKEKRLKYEALLANNPFVREFDFKSWADIEFHLYDMIISISHEEPALLLHLTQRYAQAASAGALSFAVFSIAAEVLPPADPSVYIFPSHPALMTHIKQLQDCYPRELYLSDAERTAADAWLRAQGLQAGEDLLVIVDTASKKDKLVRIDVYFGLLKQLLERSHTKVLIFDEQSLGKDVFYKEWLGEAAMQKMIFSKGLSLREDIALIGSSATRLVLGPCTGLIHCASGVFNYYKRVGIRSAEELPTIIAYTGEYPANEPGAEIWWHNSPLVSALLLKIQNGNTEVVTLNDLTDDEKHNWKQVACSYYTTDLLLECIDKEMARVSLSI